MPGQVMPGLPAAAASARSGSIAFDGGMLGRILRLGRRRLRSALCGSAAHVPEAQASVNTIAQLRRAMIVSSVVFASCPLSGLPSHFNRVTAGVSSGHPCGRSSRSLQDPGAFIGIGR